MSDKDVSEFDDDFEEEEETEEETETETTETETNEEEIMPLADITKVLSSLPPITLMPEKEITIVSTDKPIEKPPIPPSMIKTEKPLPKIIIQPTEAKKVEELVKVGKPISPTAPVEIKPVKLKLVVTLESLLKKRPTESVDMFNMRSTYSKVAMNVFRNQINPATAILIGEMAANKAFYGVTYPEENDKVIRYIDSQIHI